MDDLFVNRDIGKAGIPVGTKHTELQKAIAGIFRSCWKARKKLRLRSGWSVCKEMSKCKLTALDHMDT